jgi:hypothetical protein
MLTINASVGKGAPNKDADVMFTWAPMKTPVFVDLETIA